MEVPKKSDFVNKIDSQYKYAASNPGPNVALIMIVGVSVLILGALAQMVYWSLTMKPDKEFINNEDNKVTKPIDVGKEDNKVINQNIIGTPSTCLSFKNDLKYLSRDADTNNEVSILQDFLKNEAYTTEAPSGLFGLSTEKAIKEFQKNYGLEQTGYLDAPTKKQVEQMSCYSNYQDPEDINKVIYSPSTGTVYYLGETMRIRWNPAVIDVSTIEFKRVTPETFGDDKTLGVGIWGRQDLADPISKKGEFDYVLPKILDSFYPGKYQVELHSYGDKTIISGDEFEIKSSLPLLQRSTQPFSFNTSNVKQYYGRDENIPLRVDAREGDLSILKGDTSFRGTSSYTLLAMIYDENNDYFSMEDIRYDPTINQWAATTLKAPNIPGRYELRITLYCSYVGLESICEQKYGNWKQRETTIYFTVRQ